jgi:hypothetical protein
MGRKVERVSMDFNDGWEDWDQPDFPECPTCEGAGVNKAGLECAACGGQGDIATQEERDEFQVPEGGGWQVWETVHGSPITPVFATPEELIEHLVENGTASFDPPFRREAAEAFVRAGWAPSLVETPDGLVKGAQNADLFPPSEAKGSDERT